MESLCEATVVAPHHDHWQNGSLLTLPPPKILCHFSDWLSKCARTPGVTFICNMLRSCDILTVLWQHDENVMLERSVSTVSQAVWRLLCMFVCVCVWDRFLPTQQGTSTLYGLSIERGFLCHLGARSPLYRINSHSPQGPVVWAWTEGVLLKKNGERGNKELLSLLLIVINYPFMFSWFSFLPWLLPWSTNLHPKLAKTGRAHV